MTCSRRCSRRLLAAAAVGTAALLASCGGGGSDPPVVVVSPPDDQGSYAGSEPRPAYEMPSAALTDEDGDRLSLPDGLDAPVSVFFFGYTQCPDVCPLIMSNLALAVASLPDDMAGDVRVVLVTSDPARDDPAALRAYLERYDPDFIGLTGDLETITSVADTMGVPLEGRTRLASGGYEVEHGAQVIGYVGDHGVVVWTDSASVEDIGDDLVRMVDSAARHAGSEGVGG